MRLAETLGQIQKCQPVAVIDRILRETKALPFHGAQIRLVPVRHIRLRLAGVIGPQPHVRTFQNLDLLRQEQTLFLRHHRPVLARKEESRPRKTLQKIVHAAQRRPGIRLRPAELGRFLLRIVPARNEHTLALTGDPESFFRQLGNIDPRRTGAYTVAQDQSGLPARRFPHDGNVLTRRLLQKRLQLLRRKFHHRNRLLRHDLQRARILHRTGHLAYMFSRRGEHGFFRGGLFVRGGIRSLRTAFFGRTTAQDHKCAQNSRTKRQTFSPFRFHFFLILFNCIKSGVRPGSFFHSIPRVRKALVLFTSVFSRPAI